MVRSCIWLVSIGLMLAAAQSSWAENQRTRNSSRTQPNQSSREAGCTTKVYSLADLGDDPTLCNWIAQTIPQVIQPDSWVTNDCVGNCYTKVVANASAKILVVCQTAAVHAEVEAFLRSMSQTVAQNRQRQVPTSSAKFATSPSVLPAQFVTPNDAGSTPPMPYPVPPQTKQPKHLFHFIIRYEGDGVIDANVADYLKAVYGNLSGEQKARTIDPPTSYSAEPCVPTYMTPSGPVCVPETMCPPPGFGSRLSPAGYYVPPPPPLQPLAPGSMAPWLPSPGLSFQPGDPRFGAFPPTAQPTIPRPNDAPTQMPRADE